MDRANFGALLTTLKRNLELPEARMGIRVMLTYTKKCYFLTDEVLKGIAAQHITRAVLMVGGRAMDLVERYPESFEEAVRVSFEAHKKVRDEEWPSG